MLIEKIEVKNFRSIREEHIDFDNLTALLGRNGAGKSSFLYAIETFYDIAAPITKEDFFAKDIGAVIEIRVTYHLLRSEEEKEFKSYIKDGKLIVTKRIRFENDRIVQRYYAAASQIPKFAEIRSLPSKREKVAAWNELVDNKELPDMPGKVRGSDEAERLMLEYESKHPESMEPVEREAQFFGARTIGGGKLDNYTKFVLVPAVREASEEASHKKGAIYQILDMIVLRKVNARDDVKKLKSELKESVERVYSSDNLTELPELGKSISQTLEKFAPGSQLKLDWGEIKPPEIELPAAKATLIEDQFEGEISRKGHGLQRALIVTLLQHLSLTAPLVPLNEKEEPREDLTETESPDLILAIEEPELYLHPSRCRYLSNLLLQLAHEPKKGLGARNQIIYTSHSPYFADLHRFDQLRIVRKVPSPDSPVAQSIIRCFSLEKAAGILAEICGGNPLDFTRDSFKARAMPIMNSIVNEGFFADLVVVVEGHSEAAILWKLQEIMKKDWPKLGIALVPAGGKNNVGRPTVIFRGLSIPSYFIIDADSRHIGTNKELQTKNSNHRYLKLAGAEIVDFPDTQVNDTWAIFNDNLEAILKEAVGSETFTSLQERIATELGYNENQDVCKNTEGIARLIELIYNEGHKAPILEDIVEKVTQLHSSR